MGVIWRSQAVLPLHGQVLVDGAPAGSASTAIRFPEIYTFAVAFWPIQSAVRAWKLEGDVDYVRWRSLRNADVHFSNGSVLSNPLQWHNAVSLGVGTEYRWRESEASPWELRPRAGYFYSRAAVPNVNFTPVVPDENAHVVSAGFGLTCRGSGRFLGLACSSNTDLTVRLRGVGLDLAYQAMFFESRLITNNPNPAINGRWDRRSDVGTVTLRLSF